jgi:hypothetical protein
MLCCGQEEEWGELLQRGSERFGGWTKQGNSDVTRLVHCD